MLQLRNNLIFAPVKLGYSDKTGIVTQRHIDFYNERSKHVGAVTLEPLYMNAGLREVPTQLGIHTDEMIEGLQKLNEVIHNNGAKVIAHLNHPGRMANPKIPDNFFWSSTNRPCEAGGATPKKMNRQMMDEVINLFIESSQRAVKAGFDIIEVQLGHGYLSAQFLSPAVNNRTDEYGGNFENRIKFPLEIITAVKNAVDIPVIARITADEMVPTGFHIDEAVKFTGEVEKTGVDAVHVTTGSACSSPAWYFQHMFVPKGKIWELAKKIKENISAPVIFVGQVNKIEDIDNLKNNFNADCVAIGRALVADADFAGKYLGEVKGNVRPCLACSDGCLGGVKQGKGLGCLVNPTVNNPNAKPISATAKPKYYAVIGGGLAGMEAAVTLSKKGHKVDLYEKNRLGGQFNLAWMTPKKESMKALVPFYISELKTYNVNIINKEAIKNDILAKNYDGVVITTGAKPVKLDIEGLTDYVWADILEKDKLPENKNVLIIGGGLVGVDVAVALVAKNNKVTMVKRTEDFGGNMEMIAKKLSIKMLTEKQAVLSDHTYIKKVDGKTVYAEKYGSPVIFNNVNLIVVSAGMESHIPLKDELDGSGIPIFIAGDAKKVAKAQDAIRDAYDIAVRL